MGRFRRSAWRWKLLTLVAVLLAPTAAQAEIELFNEDGWSFHSAGRVAATYTFTAGDSDPDGGGRQQVGGKLIPGGAQNDDEERQIALSRVRSGFLGSSLSFAMRRKVNDSLSFDSLFNVRLQGISSSRGSAAASIPDFNETWAAAITPIGTFRFGRMLSIFGSASGEILLIAFRHAVGHPCQVQSAGLGCGTFGAGPIFPGYDSEFRYESPRLAGLQVKVSVQDPESTPDFLITPQPRIDGELSYKLELGEKDHILATVQGMRASMARYTQDPETTLNEREELEPIAFLGALYGEIGPVTAGGGFWQGTGIGVRTVLEIQDQSNPLAHELRRGGEQRDTRGFFGNIAATFFDTTVAVGAGSSFVKATAQDLVATDYGVLEEATEWHVTAKHKIDAMHVSMEFTNWTSKWLPSDRSNISFFGGGASYEW